MVDFKTICYKIFTPFIWLGKKLSSVWKWYKRLYQHQPWWKKTIVAIVSFILLLLVYCFSVYFNLFWLFGKSPTVDEITHPKTAAASEIYSADGKLIGKFFNENRSPVSYDEINPVFFQALISTEDERFYRHHGIDWQGLLSAGTDALRGRARGASTITQQLVKNMFKVRSEYGTGLLGNIPGFRILIMKSKEIIIARAIEATSTKKDILRMYANTVDFGSNAYGIKTAAKTYFNTTPAKLKPEEAALLVGMLKATTAYNPRINPKKSLSRRNVVLTNMYLHGYLTKAQCDSLKKIPIHLDFSVETPLDGDALYFRDAVANYVRSTLPDVDVYTDGLKIYTTIDTQMQAYAEEAVKQQMTTVQRNFDQHWRGQNPWRDENGKEIPGFIENRIKRDNNYKQLHARFPDNVDSVYYYLNKPHQVHLFSYDGNKEETMSSLDSLRYMVRFMHAGFMAMEPQTGYVRAWVGDIDYKTWQYDKVTSRRQPGSTFKMFVYATAMKQGMTPSDRVLDDYIEMQVYDKLTKQNKIWRPTNANGRFTGKEMTLRQGFAQSVNTVAVRLGQQVGIDNVIKTAQDLGVKSPLEDAPSLPLGASDMELQELVAAYSAVANEGVYTPPILVTKIVDQQGKVIYEAQPQRTQAFDWKTAFYVQKLLEAGTTDAGGTSQSFLGYIGSPYWNKQVDAGGKTGTSNNHSDAWFIGVTPGLVGGAWVGAEDRCIHFRTGALGQGSRTALPIVGLFMQKVFENPKLAKKYEMHFSKPKTAIDPNTYGGDYVYATHVQKEDTTMVDSVFHYSIDGDEEQGIDEDIPAVEEDPIQEDNASNKNKTPKKKDKSDDLFN